MKVPAIKARAQRLREGIIGKWQLRDSAPLKDVSARKGETSSSLVNTKCVAKPDHALNNYFVTNPPANFVIKAYRPSPTTSVPETASVAVAAPARPSSLTVDTKNEQQKPKTKLEAFRWKNIKKKLRFKITKLFKNIEQPTTAADSAATFSSSSPPSPALTITVPEPLEIHITPLESPSERVKRVASMAINNLGRAFSSCLPLPSLTLKIPSPTNLENFSSQQQTMTTNPSTNTENNTPSKFSLYVASLKSKGKTLKDRLKKNLQRPETTLTTSFVNFSTTTVDDMMDKMLDTININNATGRKKYKGLKVVKKLWRRASTLSAGF